ncbi:hypothetical protein [Leifsonia shinshuensis]
MRSAPPRPQAIALLIAFGVQFALGMLLNLFVQLPKTHPGSTGGEYFSRSFTSLGWALSGGGGPWLFVHAGLGLLLALGTLALFIGCLARRVRGWRWLTGVTALFTVGAFFNGMSFVDYGEDFQLRDHGRLLADRGDAAGGGGRAIPPSGRPVHPLAVRWGAA